MKKKMGLDESVQRSILNKNLSQKKLPTRENFLGGAKPKGWLYQDGNKVNLWKF